MLRRHLSWNWERKEADRGGFLVEKLFEPNQPSEEGSRATQAGEDNMGKARNGDGMGGREWGGFGIWPEYNIWLNLTESHVG